MCTSIVEIVGADGAGHGFFYWNRPIYRPEQATDGWSKVFAFLGKRLAK